MAVSKNANKEVFENYPVPKALATMAIPTIIGQLIVLIYNLADTFYIGRTNNPYMVAGAGLILPVFNLLLVFSGLAGSGGGSLVSRLLGAGREEEARKVSAFSVWLAAGMAAVFAAAIAIFMQPFLTLIGAGQDTIGYASAYATCVIVAGGIPTVVSGALAHLVRSVGASKQAGFGITMGGVLNIILDPLFMFVLFPEGMEIVGAGTATCLSNIIVLIYFIIVMRKLRSTTVLELSLKVGLPEKESIRQIFDIGVPSSIATLLFDLDYMVINRLMSGYGDIPLAAIGIVLKAERLPLNTGVGICLGMTPLIAYNYSAKNYKRLKETMVVAGVVGVICGIASLTLYEIFAPSIMRIFIENAETVAVGSVLLRIRALATTFMFLSFFPVHIFNGVGKGKYALLLGVVRWLVFNIPMQFILNHFIGMYGIALSQVTADILNVTFSFIVLWKVLGPMFREASVESL